MTKDFSYIRIVFNIKTGKFIFVCRDILFQTNTQASKFSINQSSTLMVTSKSTTTYSPAAVIRAVAVRPTEQSWGDRPEKIHNLYKENFFDGCMPTPPIRRSCLILYQRTHFALCTSHFALRTTAYAVFAHNLYAQSPLPLRIPYVSSYISMEQTQVRVILPFFNDWL